MQPQRSTGEASKPNLKQIHHTRLTTTATRAVLETEQVCVEEGIVFVGRRREGKATCCEKCGDFDSRKWTVGHEGG